MLDEMLEYHQYTFNPQDPCPVCRLKYLSLISNGNGDATFSGLCRAMIIVARYYLFEVFDKEPKSAKKEDTMNALRCWAGDLSNAQGAKTELFTPYLCGWLPNYINICLKKYVNNDEEKLKNIDRALVTLKSHEYTNFNRTNEKFLKGDFNTINAITYERITCDANQAKSLKRYYLVCKESLFKDTVRFYKSSKNTDKIKHIKEGSDIEDQMLKTLASYLLARQGNAKQEESVLVNKTYLGNWINNQELNEKYYKQFKYQGENVFEFEKYGSSQTKLKVLPKYMNDYDLRLIEEEGSGENIERFMAEHAGYTFYRDEGSGKSMTKALKYDPILCR